MTVYKFLFVYLLLLPAFCIAQRPKTNMVAKLDMISPLDDLTFPTIQLHLEQKLATRWSVEGSFGYQFYSFDGSSDSRLSDDTSYVDPSGFKVGLALRYYLARAGKHDLCGLYFSLNPFYRQNKFDARVDYDDGGTFLTDYFWAKKECWGVNMNVGFQKNMGPRFYMDTYFGVGPMGREITNYHREYDKSKGHELEEGRHSFFGTRSKLSDTNGGAVNVIIGFRLGVRLF